LESAKRGTAAGAAARRRGRAAGRARTTRWRIPWTSASYSTNAPADIRVGDLRFGTVRLGSRPRARRDLPLCMRVSVVERVYRLRFCSGRNDL